MIFLNFINKIISGKSIRLYIFLLFFAINIIFSFSLQFPSNSEEFGTLSLTAALSGRDWSPCISGTPVLFGYAQSFIYLPVFKLTSDPIIQYRIFLIINSFIISLVPVIAYVISKKFVKEENWRPVAISICAGSFPVLLLGSKFLSGETLSMLMPWVLALIFFTVFTNQKKYIRVIMSFAAAFALAFSLAADKRLLGFVVAFFAVIIFSRAVFKKKAMYLPVFVPFFLIFTAAEAYLSYSMGLRFFGGAAEFASAINVDNFLGGAFSALYYFAVSTWGIGALALMVSVVLFAAIFRRKKNGVKYNEVLTLLAVFAVTAFVLIIAGTSFFNSILAIDTLNSVIPFLITLFLSFVLTHGMDFQKTISAVLFLCGIYIGMFFFSAAGIIRGDYITQTDVAAVLPIRFGVDVAAPIDYNSLLLSVSCSLCVLSIFIVIVCCSKKLRGFVISLLTTAILIYSMFFTGFAYLPTLGKESGDDFILAANISKSVFNKEEAPIIISYKTPNNLAIKLQYLNQNVSVICVNSPREFYANAIVVAPSNININFMPRKLILIETHGAYSVYAYGERAVAYARSQGAIEEVPTETSSEETSSQSGLQQWLP